MRGGPRRRARPAWQRRRDRSPGDLPKARLGDRCSPRSHSRAAPPAHAGTPRVCRRSWGHAGAARRRRRLSGRRPPRCHGEGRRAACPVVPSPASASPRDSSRNAARLLPAGTGQVLPHCPCPPPPPRPAAAPAAPARSAPAAPSPSRRAPGCGSGPGPPLRCSPARAPPPPPRPYHGCGAGRRPGAAAAERHGRAPPPGLAEIAAGGGGGGPGRGGRRAGRGRPLGTTGTGHRHQQPAPCTVHRDRELHTRPGHRHWKRHRGTGISSQRWHPLPV